MAHILVAESLGICSEHLCKRPVLFFRNFSQLSSCGSVHLKKHTFKERLILRRHRCSRCALSSGGGVGVSPRLPRLRNLFACVSLGQLGILSRGQCSSFSSLVVMDGAAWFSPFQPLAGAFHVQPSGCRRNFASTIF